MDNASQLAKSGATWQAISQIVQPAWEFFVGILLARILSPKEFGIVAMGMILCGLATSLSNLGIPNVIIQKDNLDEVFVRTSQTIAILIGVALYLVLIASSYFMHTIFDEPLAGEVIRIFGVVFVINSVAMVPSALMIREMKFKANALVTISSSLIYGIAALVLAIQGYGLWSLVYAPMLSVAYRCLLLCVVTKYVPKLGWSKESAIHIGIFGGRLTASSILNFAARNVDFLIIGKFLGPTHLGLYKRAYDLAVIPKEKVADSLSSVLLPFLCKIKHDKKWVKSAFIKSNKASALICMPVLFFFALNSTHLITALYGEKWIAAVPAFRIISLGGICYALMAPLGSILIAYGETEIYFKLQLIYSSLLVVSALVGVQFGILGVAIGAFLSLAIMFLISFYMTSKIIHLSLKEFVASLRLPLEIGLVTAVTTQTFGSLISFESSLFNVIFKLNLFALIYALFIAYSKDPILSEVREFIRGMLSRKKRLIET